ncbi:hypothetical protein FJT64_005506 [Amphibalanus amphitrite]|uniref:Uncharacterized protein n=1 Tax=Amphibalanus amphitrite TaxID=1232801 RepID=A0A6A4VVT1_AMPAM|nr:hypothetical protein FJT64_005506 [Amphibalanus amphitrite]
MARPRVSGLSHRRQATMVKPVEVGSTSSVLRRWPLVWRLAAVATGVLPLCEAVCARRQPRFRLLSAPGVIAVTVTVIYSVHAISWLTPQSFGGLRIGSHLVKVVLRAFTNLAQVASVCSAPALASLRARFVSAADLTATLSDVFAPPTVYYLAHTVLISMLVVAMSDSRPQTAIFVADVTLLSVRSALLVAVLCQGGQRLEEAARRPAELLLRHPPEDPAAAAEAARLVALVNWLRPAAVAPGVFSINRQLLGSTVAGYMTYMVVLVQMGE